MNFELHYSYNQCASFVYPVGYQELIWTGMQIIEQHTCITFRWREEGDRDYVVLKSGSGQVNLIKQIKQISFTGHYLICLIN